MATEQHNTYLFTSESVTEGHPDKICDQISDAILDAILEKEIQLQNEGYVAPDGQPADVTQVRCACETMVTTGLAIVAGEIRTQAWVDVQSIVRDVITGIGYDRAKYGYDGNTCGVLNAIHEQSPDIAMGVDESWETKQAAASEDPYEKIGAGDQGLMFGYATNETPELLPLPFAVATRALELLRDRHSPLLLPDAKSQVTFDYCGRRIHTFLISTQHHAYAGQREIYELVRSIMDDVADAYGLNHDFRALVNPTGRFVRGGSYADTGVTGRKIVADTYGGVCRSGGGALSGKDPTKVDRSAAYMARKIACDIVRERLALRCEVQLAYAIGMAAPISVSAQFFGTNREPPHVILRHINSRYDLTPGGIIEGLGLKDVDYNRVSAYGHFGKAGLPWEA